MKHLKFLTLLFLGLTLDICAQNSSTKGEIILYEPGFPFIFELNQGESQVITRSYQGKTIKRTISLESIKPFTETNLWFNDGVTANYYQVNVGLNVSGKKAILH